MRSTHLRELFLFLFFFSPILFLALFFFLTWRREGRFRKDAHVFKTLFSYI